MVKIYRSKKWTTHVMMLKVGKNTIQIPFVNGTTDPTFRGGEYSTDDEAIQKALESHPDYNKVFVNTGQIENKVVEPKYTEVNEVANIQQAKNYLEMNYEDITKTELANKTAVLKAAENRGLVFPNIK